LIASEIQSWIGRFVSALQSQFSDEERATLLLALEKRTIKGFLTRILIFYSGSSMMDHAIVALVAAVSASLISESLTQQAMCMHQIHLFANCVVARTKFVLLATDELLKVKALAVCTSPNLTITVGSSSTKTARGTCFPAPVSLKVLKASHTHSLCNRQHYVLSLKVLKASHIHTASAIDNTIVLERIILFP
jgi:hypothetical protein